MCADVHNWDEEFLDKLVEDGDLVGIVGGVAADEGELYDVEFIFEQFIHDIDHAFSGHGFFGHHQAAIRMGGGEGGFEGRTFHGIGRASVADVLFIIDFEYCREKRIIGTEDQRVVEVLKHVPGDLFDFITGIDHVHAVVDGVFHFDGEFSGVTVQILRFAFEVVEAVGILKVKMGNASHSILLLLYVEA